MAPNQPTPPSPSEKEAAMKEIVETAEDASTKFAPHDGSVTTAAFIARFAAETPEQRTARSRALLRKVDLHTIPFLVIMYLLNFLDRSNLAQARQGTLEEDLGMGGTDFNLATSIFFVGYLLMQLPSNMLITRVRPSLYLSAACVLWGVVSTCNAATHSFHALVVVRFFLGFVEAPFFPGAVFLMSSWYTRSELTQRMSWFYSGNALANMFGGLLGAAILGNLEGHLGLAGWRWLFIIEGVITIGMAIIAAFFLPDYPATTTWLNDEEKHFAAWRLRADINEEDERHARSAVEGAKLALKDYRLYLFVMLQHLNTLAMTFQYFFPSIVNTLGYGRIETLWLTAPVWFATWLVTILTTYTSSRTGDRSIHIVCLFLVAITGNIIATATTNHAARFFAMFLMPMGAVSSFTIVIPWIANSFPRPLVKRSASIAVCNMIGNCASIYGSYMYPKSEAPRYIPGGSANAVVCFLVMVMAVVLRYVHVHENKKLEAAEGESADGESTEVRNANRRAAGFRYVY